MASETRWSDAPSIWICLSIACCVQRARSARLGKQERGVEQAGAARIVLLEALHFFNLKKPVTARTKHNHARAAADFLQADDALVIIRQRLPVARLDADFGD